MYCLVIISWIVLFLAPGESGTGEDHVAALLLSDGTVAHSSLAIRLVADLNVSSIRRNLEENIQLRLKVTIVLERYFLLHAANLLCNSDKPILVLAANAIV